MAPTADAVLTRHPRTVPGLLAARAAVEPDRAAILPPGGDPLTFADWDRRSDAVAHGLIERGVRRGDRVGLQFGGTGWIDYAVAYFAVQKAGGVAVPLSDGLPPAQAGALLTQVEARMLVTAAPATGWDGAVSTMDELAAGGADAGPVNMAVGPEDLAQIVFTSGTTGRAKGVAASHANLTFGHEPLPRQRRFAHSDVFLHAFPIGTNGAQTMLMYAVTAHPAALAMARFDAEEFGRLVETLRVGTVFLVPSMAIDLLNAGIPQRHDLSGIALLTSSAAALPPAVSAALADALPDAVIVNYYTSTEAAPASTTMIVDPERPDSVGRPADRGELLIADAGGSALPPGEVGEIWLRSPGLPGEQRSYFGDPAATAAVFRRGWVRMGDVGYLDAEGYLYIVDRDSDVVKAGAFKVSTLRIEAALYEHPDVAEAAVVGLPHPVMGTVLAAAVVLRRPLPAGALTEFLAGRLARHEVPTRLLAVESLPRNETGKVVKGEVRELFRAAARPPSAGPAAPTELRPTELRPTELRLRRIWAGVLNVPDAGPTDDFFALGGDSFSAARLAAAAAAGFGVELPVSFAFDVPTLAGQAAAIDSRPRRPDVGQAPPAAHDGVPLHALQEYFLRWMYETPTPRAVSAVAVAIRITDELDPALLRTALGDLVARHDALRTVFPRGAGVRVLPALAPEFSAVTAASPATALELGAAALERPFDVERGPLVRALVATVGTDDHVLVLGVHHLVFDGWSMGVLLRELGLRYAELRAGRAEDPAPQPVSSADVAAWARQRWPAAREFWRRELAGAPPALPGAPRRRRPDRYAAESLPVRISATVADRIRAIAAAHRATTFMGVAAAWAAVLGHWAGAGEVVLQAPVPGRTRPEFDAVMGCLAQPVLLRMALADDPAFGELVERVRDVALRAAEHQYHPFDEVNRQLPHPGWLRFESWAAPAHVPGLESEPLELPRELMFEWPMPDGEPDLSVPELALVEQPDGTLTGWLVYNRHAFDRPAVDRLARAFVAYLGDRR